MSVVAVCSGKGSPGATLVAVNLAAAAAREGRDVLLVDLDPAGGDVCCYLGLDPRKGLYPLLRMDGGTPDAERLFGEAEERFGFRVVCGFPESAPLVPATLGAVLRAGGAAGCMVIADLGRVGEATADVAAEADRVLMVVRPDVVSVLGAARALRMLDGSVARERVAGVLTGFERRRPADRVEVEDALGLPIVGTVPWDRRGAARALVSQGPATTRRLKHAFDSLAEAMADPSVEAQPAPVTTAAQPIRVGA